MELTEKLLKSCWNASSRVVKVSGGYVERQDAYQEIVMRLLKATDEEVEKWDTTHALTTVLYRMGLAYVEEERHSRTGSKRGDFTYYTPGLLEELLPDCWGEAPTTSSGSARDAGGIRGKSRPSESGNWLAMVIDVRGGLLKMTPDNLVVLRALYSQDGIGLEALALAREKTEDAMRKVARRILWRLTEKLGGEPPFYPRSRKAISNAHAQAITQHQETE